jgi:hypothetical protein
MSKPPTISAGELSSRLAVIRSTDPASYKRYVALAWEEWPDLMTSLGYTPLTEYERQRQRYVTTGDPGAFLAMTEAVTLDA